MSDESAQNGDNLLVLDAVDKPQTMADDPAENGESRTEESEERQESSKHRRRSRSPIDPPGRRGRGGGSGTGRRFGGYRGGDRDNIDNKTNSEEPHLKRARLFVGNISTDSVKRRDLARLFSQYGRVLGVSIHGGYAFVQMDRERDANRAILSEDGNTFMGSKIHVEFSQAAKQAGARRVHHNDPTPPPLMRERERDFVAAAAHLDDRITREERLERVLMLEREMAYLKAREDLYTEMFTRSQVEPPSLPLYEQRREESYRRPPLSPPPSNPYPPPRDRDYHVDHSERGLDDHRPYYSRSEASGSSYHGQPADTRTDLLSYPLPRNRGGSGPRGAELLAAAYGGAATSGKSVGYGGSMTGGGNGYGSSKTAASGGYGLGKPPSSSWLSSHDYPRGGGGGSSRSGPYSSGGYWN